MYANLEDRLSAGELQLENKSNIGWSRHVPCCTNTIHELKYWLQHLRLVNDQPFQRAGQIRVIEADLGEELLFSRNFSKRMFLEKCVWKNVIWRSCFSKKSLFCFGEAPRKS
jgi:hypothetical protein